MLNTKQDLIDVYQGLYKEPLTEEMAQEADDVNLSGFLNLLCEIDLEVNSRTYD